MNAQKNRRNHFGGENQFKIHSENPSKPPWRGKTSDDNMIFPANTISAGNIGTNSNPG